MRKNRRVAVIGGGLGGMTAAGELAAAGHQVTLFEATGRLGGKAGSYTWDGFTLDTGPTLLTLPNIVRAAFERMHASDLLPPFVELERQAEYRFPDGARLTAFSDLEQTAVSAGQIDAAEYEGTYRFYREAERIHLAAGEPYLEAPFESLWQFMARVGRRGPSAVWTGMRMPSLYQMAERHFHTAHLRQFVARFATYAGASPYQASAAFALIPHLERVLGVHHVKGGIGALAAALERALRRLNVQVEVECRASWTPLGRGFLVGTEEHRSLFDAVVVNEDPLRARGAVAAPLALSGYVALVEANRRLSLPHHLVLFSKDYRQEFEDLFGGRMPSELTVYLCHPAASDQSMAPPGKSALFVMVNAPALASTPTEGLDESQGWARQGAQLQARCLSLIRRHCGEEIKGVELRVVGERTPVDLARLGAPGGSIYGALPHGKLGPFRRPKIRGALPGLFYSGGGAQPGGGVPLVMLSGHFAAQLAQAHLREVA